MTNSGFFGRNNAEVRPHRHLPSRTVIAGQLRLPSRVDTRRALRITAGVAVAMFAFGVAAARTREFGPAVPREHDEFSYLLGADTFRRARLTNPPHFQPQSFDTFHVIQRPTYASKYPPAQSLVLAMGWEFGGHPIVGVWLGFAGLAAALYWSAAAWLDGGWALITSIAVTSYVGMSYWTHTYWGGAVAAAGSALAYGAFPSLSRRPTVVVSLILGFGLIVLANSRPFEGLLVTVPVAIGLAWSWSRCGITRQRSWLTRALLPLLAIGTVGVLAMAAYNHAVTGSALTFPYIHYERDYAVVPTFVWQAPIDRTFNEPRHQAFAAWTLAYFAEHRGLQLSVVGARLLKTFTFFVPGVLFFPLLAAPLLWRDRRFFIPIAGIFATVGAICVSTWYQPHYSAPGLAPLAIIYFACLRRIHSASALPRFVRVGITVATLATWILPPMSFLFIHRHDAALRRRSADWAQARSNLIDSLSSQSKQYVLLVSYDAGYSPHNEWVFNGADIDSQHVIWARDLGRTQNHPLIAYYRAREVLDLRITSESPPYYRLEPDVTDP